MPNYIDDDLPLYDDKVQIDPIPAGEEDNSFSADDATSVKQFLYDARDAIQALQGAPVIGDSILGPGYDGDLTFNGTDPVVVNGTTFTPSSNVYTLSRSLFANSITMTGSASIDTGGWLVFCRGAITGGTIERNGNNGVGNGQGAAQSGQSLPGALTGGQGGTAGSGVKGGNSTEAPWPFVAGFAASVGAGGGNGNNGAIGQGGSGGGGSVGAGAEGGTVTAATRPTEALHRDAWLKGRALDNVLYTCGSGGGGGGSGGANAGGGGGGGGWVVVCAKSIVGCTISARGGNGGNAAGGNAGGGGGGSGGWVLVVIGGGSVPTTDVSGGTGGNKSGTGGIGGNGGSGFALVVDLSA